MSVNQARQPSVDLPDNQLHQVIQQAIVDLRCERADACIAACETALSLQPDCAEAVLLLGLTSLQLGEPAHAATLIAKAYDLRPDVREFAQALSIANAQLGNINDGLFYTKLATTLPPHPEFPDILPPPYDNFLANVEEARPGLYRARADRLATDGDYPAAIDAAIQQLTITPGDYDTLRILATASRKAGSSARALATGRALTHSDERQPIDFVTQAQALTADGQYAAATALLESSLCHGDAAALAARAVNALRDPASSMAQIHSAHVLAADQLNEDSSEHPGQRARRHTRRKGAPLRVGYLSSLFQDGDLAHLVAPIVSAHISHGVEVYCYTDSPCQDLVSEQFAHTSTRWTSLAGVDDRTAARILDGDQLDIAVDLTGHFPGNRLAALWNSTVPVTASWFGYPHPCGPDHFITTSTIWPAWDQQDDRLATVAYLPDPIVPYAPPAIIPAVGSSPVLTNGHTTFGAVGDLAHVGHATVAAWNEVFIREPSSRVLVLGTKGHDEPTIERCYAVFADFGLRDRVDIIDAASNFATPFEFYHHIDVALAPPTAARVSDICRALWMGVPVLCSQSERPIDRGAASILTAANHPEWIAASPDDLAAIAHQLCHDHRSLVTLRADLRAQVSSSPLADIHAAASRLEAVYRDLVTAAIAKA